MKDQIFLFLINLFLIGYIFFKERQHQKIIKEILASKLAKDVFEFQNLTKTEKEEKPKIEESIVEIEEAPPEKLIEALKKVKE